MSFSYTRACGIIANIKNDVTIGESFFFYPEGKEPTGNGSYRINGAPFSIKNTGSILLALHHRQIKDHLTAIIPDFDITAVIVKKCIYKLRPLFSRFFSDSGDILLSEIDKIGLMPKLLNLIQRNEIIKIKRSLVVATGSASLALEPDILKSNLHHNAGQNDSPKKE
jgi:hypothetical protein